MKNINFRPAMITDLDMLLEWRNDPLTRQNSINNQAVALKDHQNWLEQSLQNPKRKLFVALLKNEPIGTVRLDECDDGFFELSWTIAPKARGQGFGKIMVKAATELVPGPIRAKIKLDNSPSNRIALYAGFKKVSNRDGLATWEISK